MKSSNKNNDGTSGTVIELDSVRAQRAADERRRIQRIFLKDMFQVFVSNGRDGTLYPVEVNEASEDGCSFRVPLNAIPEASEVFSGPLQVRIYMSQQTYLSIGAEVKNVNPMVDEGGKFLRFGCSVDTTFASYEAYKQLVKFMEAWAGASKKDLRKVVSG